MVLQPNDMFHKKMKINDEEQQARGKRKQSVRRKEEEKSRIITNSGRHKSTEPA